jgi:hypothetical protein
VARGWTGNCNIAYCIIGADEPPGLLRASPRRRAHPPPGQRGGGDSRGRGHGGTHALPWAQTLRRPTLPVEEKSMDALLSRGAR